jgi:hypothetical protein
VSIYPYIEYCTIQILVAETVIMSSSCYVKLPFFIFWNIPATDYAAIFNPLPVLDIAG